MRFTVIRMLVGSWSVSVVSLLAAVVSVLLLALCGLVAPAWGSSSCPNELFRTGPGSNLPDCRAYEMVSPPDKNGGEVDGGDVFEGVNPAPQQAALDGEAVTYGAQTTFTEANPQSSLVTGQYLSRRGPSGWYTQAITPKQDLPGGGFDTNPGSLEFNPFQGFSEDLEHSFLVAYNPVLVPGAPANYFDPYVRDDRESSYQVLSTVAPPVQQPGPADGGGKGFKVEYAGMSADGSHVVFAANDALTPGAVPGARQLYEWSAGHLELVSVLPNGESETTGFFGFPAQDQGGLYEDDRNAISSDGSRVFWTSHRVNGAGELVVPAPLFMHEVTAGGARTVEVSASQRSEPDPSGTLAARYWTASRDGSRVFFASCEKLTNDSTATVAPHCGYEGEAASGQGEDLYMYDANTGSLSDLSVDPGRTASVSDVIGASEDGSYVYFVAWGALAPGAEAGASTTGARNIYVWHDGVVRFIAALHESENVGEKDYSLRVFGGLTANSQELVEHAAARVSPSGRYLTFESSASLTGYNNLPAQAGACARVGEEFAGERAGTGTININETGRCLEVYEYDAVTGHLVCVSCNPTGVAPVGSSILPFALHGLIEHAGWQTSTVQQRYLLDDGRVFFDSSDALLAQASNGSLNVYEYEPDGVGGCHTEGGCIALISSGTSSDASFFMDASASGDDAFFITRQRLVAQDGDDGNDVYDARVGGGFSAATPPPCGGEACRPPVTPAPSIYGAPPSATFEGPGNPPSVATPVVSKAKGKAKAKGKRKRKARRRGHRRPKGKGARRGSVRAGRSSGGSHR